METAKKKPSIVKQTIGDPLVDEPHAPIMFFDRVPSVGLYSSIVHVSLAAARNLPCMGELRESPVAVAYLRMNLLTAVDLRDALNKALAMAAPVSEGSAN